MRFISLCLALATLTLAGCANDNLNATLGANGQPKPKTVIVSDFVVAADVPAIDRGFTTRQESKGGYFPILERRQRTLERVNDEIIATVVASLRDAGLGAEPGSAEVAAKTGGVRLAGRMHAPEEGKRLPVTQLGFGSGRGHVVADMTLSKSGFGREDLFNFAVDLPTGRKPAGGKTAAAHGAAIASILAEQGAAPEKLSPDVEAQARQLGEAIAGRVIAYAKEQGWLAKPDPAEAAPEEKPAKKPAAKPKKPPTT